MHTKFWSESLKGGDDSGDLSIDGRIIFEWILGICDVKAWTGCIWFRKGPVVVSCGHGKPERQNKINSNKQ
jgi:hypothetical protein